MESKKKRLYEGISKERAYILILHIFRNLVSSDIRMVLSRVRQHGDCRCAECRRFRGVGIYRDIAMTTLYHLSQEFSKECFLKLLQLVKRRQKLMMDELKLEMDSREILIEQIRLGFKALEQI